MNKPNGHDLLKTLVELYAEQCNVKVSCEIQMVEKEKQHER